MLYKLIYKTKPHNLPYKDLLVDIMDKMGFAIAFCLGATGILFLKAIHVSQSWVTLYPVSIMILYAAIIYFNNRLRIAEEQAGDNLYYLGFLFTLISLSCALYQFNGEGGNALIIENFGIALATTIVGLLLRILFNKMRHDPVEIEHEARLELASTATRLRTDLIEVTKTMKSTLIAAQQHTSEIISDYESRFETLQKSSFDHSDNVQKKSNELIQAIETLLERIVHIETPTNILEKKLDPAIEYFKQAGSEVLNRVKSDEQSIKQVTALVKSAIESSEHLDNKINILSEHSEHIYSTFSGLNLICTQLADSSKKMNEIANQASQVTTHQSEAAENLNQAVSKASENFKKIIEIQNNALSAFEQNLNSSLLNIQNHNEKLATELNLSREYTSKVHNSLVSLTDSLSNQISDLSSNKTNHSIQ